MNSTAPLHRSDVRPQEFILAVLVGGSGSFLLSFYHWPALTSVGFALVIMVGLAIWRWAMANKSKDSESLEVFAEDIYLLGYLLTLSALLGLAPRLMSEDTNLFNIAGLKLVTTVVGLALMMIFRQLARRWAQAEQGKSDERFQEQQAQFSAAVARLNKGADDLTSKLNEVVHRFDPETLHPVAEWSNRAAGAFSVAATHLEAIPASILKGVQQFEALGRMLEQLKTAAAELAGIMSAGTAQAANVLTAELGHASHAANGLGVSVAALRPAGDAAKVAIENLGGQAALGATRLTEVSTGLHGTALELGKVEQTLKKIIDLHAGDPNLPMKRLVEALENSAVTAGASVEGTAKLNEGLQTAAAASQDLANRMGPEFAKPILDHQQMLDRVEKQLVRSGEQLEQVGKQLQSVVNARAPDGDHQSQLLARLNDLVAETRATNVHLKSLAARTEENPDADGKPGMLARFLGKR